MEAIVLVVIILCLAYACFWEIRNDEIYAERRNKERFRIEGAPEEFENQ